MKMIFIKCEDVFLLYIVSYNKNIYCHYIREYIMTINISLTYENTFLLYETMYNKNIYCNCTRSYIIQIFLLYMKMYFCYTRRYITEIFVIII